VLVFRLVCFTQRFARHLHLRNIPQIPRVGKVAFGYHFHIRSTVVQRSWKLWQSCAHDGGPPSWVGGAVPGIHTG
jgi:hypothetical protein